MVAILTRRLEFPPATTANRDGLVAVGGDLSMERLLLAYRNGIFPWPIFDDDLMTWFSPDPRAILDLDALHVSRSLRKVLKRKTFEITTNQAFIDVIRGCAAPAAGRMSTWITPELKRAYIELHRAGYAHSVEVWSAGRLVGGLYGVAIGGMFAGESMFSRETNASKVALVHLVERLVERGYGLLDIQQGTPHMINMGGRLIPRREYLARLREVIDLDRSFG